MPKTQKLKKALSLLLLAILLSFNLSLITLADDWEDIDGLTTTEAPGEGPIAERTCPGSSTKIWQNQNGTNICATFDNSQEDYDGDGINNLQDRCPTINNDADSDPDTEGIQVDEDLQDNDFDGLYDNKCDFFLQQNALLAMQDELDLNELDLQTEQQNVYNAQVEGFGACLPTAFSGHAICNSESVSQNASSLNATETANFEKLNNALQNNQIIQILDEPISNDYLFKKARVCSTKFLRDANGVLVPADRIDLYRIFNNDNDNNDSPSAMEEAYNNTNFIITNDKCEEFFVQTCHPTPFQSDSIKISEATSAGLPTKVYCTQVQALFADSGTDLLKVYVNLIYRWAVGIIGVFSVIVILINGILISASNGDSSKVEAAKGRIIQSLMGLALLFLSGILLYSINPNFFRPEDVAPDTTTEDGTGEEEPEAGNSEAYIINYPNSPFV